jgi:hypothetical protein
MKSLLGKGVDEEADGNDVDEVAHWHPDKIKILTKKRLFLFMAFMLKILSELPLTSKFKHPTLNHG